jgi:hypothetical protein
VLSFSECGSEPSGSMKKVGYSLTMSSYLSVFQRMSCTVEVLSHEAVIGPKIVSLSAWTI